MIRVLALVALVAGCESFASGGGGGGDADAPGVDSSGTGPVHVFDPSTTHVVIEIDYETGQAPYTGPIVGFGDTFDPTVTNLDRLFSGTREVTLPRTLADMQDVGAIADEELTVEDILGLAAQHRDARDTAGTKTYYVLFVSGVFADAEGRRPTVLGVAIGDTIAMFKDVIRSTSVLGLPNVVRYVEQATLIHELAHAIGLVDLGVPMTSPHKDAEHGPHCTNDACVMYWLNNASGDAAAYAQQYLLTGSTILFDAPCLADVDALTGGP
jgi:hypothetical protein